LYVCANTLSKIFSDSFYRLYCLENGSTLAIGLNECTRLRPLWFHQTPLKMAIPSNSALFKGIGGDVGQSHGELIIESFIQPIKK